MAENLYPRATHITDIYHAREHLTDLANHLAFITPDPAQWLQDRSAELDAGNIQAIIDAARRYPLEGARAEDLEKKLGYFQHNEHLWRCTAASTELKAITTSRWSTVRARWWPSGASASTSVASQS